MPLINEELRFDAKQGKQCVSLTLVDNEVREEDEILSCILSLSEDSDRRIHLNPTGAIVTIIDDDV